MNKRETAILLETGTNELEVLEFIIGGNHFGINVAKIRELIQYKTVQKMPHAQPSVEGIMRSRNEVLTVVDLGQYMGFPPSEDVTHDILIIASFNEMSVAFHVQKVEGILRVSWEDIEKPSTAIYGDEEGVVTGIVKLEDRMISLIDFEKIMVDINPSASIQAYATNIKETQTNDERPIVIAEDSVTLSKMIVGALHKAGYSNITSWTNGLEAWEYLLKLKERPGSIGDYVSCLITDIEMPKMDGHHLTKRVKDDSVLQSIPVIIFSSLISEENKLKGKAVGADAQLSKPEIGLLVGEINKLIL